LALVRRLAGGSMAGYRVEKPWGYELVWARTERYAGKLLHIHRGEALSFQYHRIKDETIYVLRGALELEVCAEGERRRRTVRLSAGDGYHIAPGTRHRMTALEECDVLEASTPELDDLVRLEDRYGRVRR
jgi:quercetin dioxygenase-like cupin family protein